MFKLARFSVTYPTTIMMIVLGILLLGYISFSRLGIDLLPDLNNPRLFVEIKSGERPPLEMEQQFVINVEAAVSRLSKVEDVSSLIRVGRALLTVEYSWDADMDESLLDLQKALTNFSRNDNIEELNVSKHDPNAAPVMLAALSHPEITDLDELRKTVENNIRNELIRLEGVAAVQIVGARKREVEILTDAYTLEAFGVTIDQIAGRLQTLNRNMSGGSIVEMGRRYVIKGVGEFSSLENIEDLIITYKENTQSVSRADQIMNRVPVYLRELATVNYVLSEPENIVHVNGKRCIGLEIQKETKFNTLNAVDAINERLDELRKALPGYDLKVIQDQGRFISSSIKEVQQTGIIGIILAIVILFVFLRRLGVTMIISTAIPISVVATFNLMFFNGLSLNIMTLGGIALGAGMLVDNAIVVVENIFRNLEEGKSLKEAAIAGAGQVGGAITSSTLTTIVVFLPIVYLHGATGELFLEQAWTVAFSLISSLFVAILVIPMLATKFLKNNKTTINVDSLKFPGYKKLLQRVIEKRYLVLTLSVAAILITIFTIPFIGNEFIPRSDQGEFYINVTLPEGTSLERTEGTVRNMEAMLLDHYQDDISSVYSRIGPSIGSSANEPVLTDENNALIHIILKSDRSSTTSKIVTNLNQLFSSLPNLELEFVQQQTALQNTMGTDVAPLVVEIKGANLYELEELSENAYTLIKDLPDIMNLESSFQKGRPEINIIIDPTAAAQFSLTTSEIANQISDLLGGRNAGQLEYQGEYFDILIRQPEISVDELQKLYLKSSDGKKVHLTSIATLEKNYSPREIVRKNQSRIGRLTAQLEGDFSFDKVVTNTEEKLAELTLPPNYTLEVAGEEKKRQEAFNNLRFALILAIILVYMVMASQFESLIHPFVIILTIPLAAVGAVWALLVSGISFNIMSYIGIIMLTGIAVNDSIILVDCINQLRRSGKDLKDAIIIAGQMRIRPILMTSLTTMLALLPLTIGIGEGASLRSPMAVAVIGGLATSTLLTLIVIPAVYYVIAGKSISRKVI